jgi:hypothetical protein
MKMPFLQHIRNHDEQQLSLILAISRTDMVGSLFYLSTDAPAKFCRCISRVLLKEKIKIRLFGKAYAVAVILQAPVCL